MNNHMKALWIAIIASILDQVVHISLNLIHQIYFIFDWETGTAAYIFFKLLFVYAVSWYVLEKDLFKTILTKSIVISLIAAGAFTVLLSYLYPNQYTSAMHMMHAVAMFIAANIVLRNKSFK